MKVAIIHNKDLSKVINSFGIQNKEKYNVKTVNRVAEALESNGHNVEIIDGNMNVMESLQGFMPKVLEGEKMGIVFNMAYGIQGESRYTHIPSMLEMVGIPYVGSNPSGHALALDKVITKIILQKHGIPTPQFWVFSSHLEDMSDVIFPVIVKPKMEAVSFGLKVVYNQEEVKGGVEFIINEYKQQALVEQFIRGREFAVGMLGNNPIEAFPVLEIDLEGDPDAIQTSHDKRKAPREKICPAKIPEQLAVKMQEESIRAFKALLLHDFARVDIRMDEKGDFYILEINSMASLGLTGAYFHAAQAAGYDYTSMVNKMLDVAAQRYFGEKYETEKTRTGKKSDNTSLKIKSYLRNKQGRYYEMLKSFVNCNTYVRNIEGVNKLSGRVRKYLTELGFAHQVFPQAEIGNLLYFSNSDDQETDLLFLCNLDNTLEIGSHRYFLETEQKFFGTGVWENKGGLVTLIAALQACRSLKVLEKRKISVLLTTDSTINNKISASLITQKSNEAKYVIGLTGAFLDGGIVTSRSGSASYSINMNMVDSGSEKNISEFAGLYSKLTSSLLSLSDEQEGILVFPSKMSFDSNMQTVTAHGKINLGIRFMKAGQIDELEPKILNLVPKKYKAMVDLYTGVGDKRPPMLRSEKVEMFWKMVKSIANQMDIRIREEHRWYSADICFVPEDKLRLGGMGPVGAKDENKQYILKYSIIERSALLAMVITKLDQQA